MKKREKTLAERYTTLKRGSMAVAVSHGLIGAAFVLLAILGYGSGFYLWFYLVLGVVWIALGAMWVDLSRKHGQTAEKLEELEW